jgi:hypothetical protein
MYPLLAGWPPAPVRSVPGGAGLRPASGVQRWPAAGALALRAEHRLLRVRCVPARGLQRGEGDLQVLVQRHGAAPGRAFAGAVLELDRLGDLPVGLGDHGPRQRREGCGAEPGLDRYEPQTPIPVRSTGGRQGPPHGPLVGGTDALRVLALQGGLPGAALPPFIR